LVVLTPCHARIGGESGNNGVAPWEQQTWQRSGVPRKRTRSAGRESDNRLVCMANEWALTAGDEIPGEAMRAGVSDV
jgi:hypothetical protein